MEELFKTHRARVLALCLHLLGDRAEAEDALQETFLAVLRSLNGFRGDANVSTWIYRIALRAALKRKARLRAHATAPLDAATNTHAEDPRERIEQRAELTRALESLSAEHRVVLCLFAIEGLTHKEIAEILGVPEGTIWSRLHAARKRLSASLAGHLDKTNGRAF